MIQYILGDDGMPINFRAVSKKERIRKTLMLGIPASIIIGIIGSFVIMIAQTISFNIVYYASILGIGYVVGLFVRKVGKGTTIEFIYIAGFLALISIIIAIYFTFAFRGMWLSLPTFFSKVIFNLPGMAQFSFVEIIFGVVVAIMQANTVQFR